jgi:hypothetical protein
VGVDRTAERLGARNPAPLTAALGAEHCPGGPSRQVCR